jgi:hypothetical protein
MARKGGKGLLVLKTMAANTRRRKREEGTRLPLLLCRHAGDLRSPLSSLTVDVKSAPHTKHTASRKKLA